MPAFDSSFIAGHSWIKLNCKGNSVFFIINLTLFNRCFLETIIIFLICLYVMCNKYPWLIARLLNLILFSIAFFIVAETLNLNNKAIKNTDFILVLKPTAILQHAKKVLSYETVCDSLMPIYSITDEGIFSDESLSKASEIYFVLRIFLLISQKSFLLTPSTFSALYINLPFSASPKMIFRLVSLPLPMSTYLILDYFCG